MPASERIWTGIDILVDWSNEQVTVTSCVATIVLRLTS